MEEVKECQERWSSQTAHRHFCRLRQNGRLQGCRPLWTAVRGAHHGGEALADVLINVEELEFAGVADLGRRAASLGIESRFEPILDQSVPTVAQMDAIAQWVEQGLRTGHETVLHCLGGLGRSGTVAACLLARRGMPPAAAIAAVREVRGPRSVETRLQEQFVHDYAAVAKCCARTADPGAVGP